MICCNRYEIDLLAFENDSRFFCSDALRAEKKIVGLSLQNLLMRAVSAYMYGRSKLYGSIMFVAIVLFITVGIAHHVKYGFAEYVFLKLGRDDRAKSLMMDLYNSAPITRICYAGYIVFIIALIAAILSGTAGFPLWAAIFTILPVFIILFPFRIIGTLHIAAIVSMLVWMILL